MGKVTGNVYLTALFLTGLLLVVGFILGVMFQEGRQNKWDTMYLKTANTLDFLLFLDNDSFCALYPIYEEEIRGEIDYMVHTLEALEKAGRLTDEMKNPFYILQFKEYLLLQRAHRECGRRVTFLFYFYSGDDIKDRLKELEIQRRMTNYTRLYVFDGRSSFPVVRYLKKRLCVRELPALVEFVGDLKNNSCSTNG